MTFDATCITLMIASPGDVVLERVIARDIAYEWNAIHSRTRSQVLIPVGWETHSIPAMSDRPQALINDQVLKDADILVAVFWTRLGSSTGKAVSGTVEEIEEHISTGRPVLIYFSRTPVTLDSVDAQQYASLTNFRESPKSRGLYQDFDDASDFQAKFSRHLSKTINKDFRVAGIHLDDIGKTLVKKSPTALSPEAAQILKVASKDPSGRIMVLRLRAGLMIQTNGVSFTKQGDPRSEALWLGAISELEIQVYVEARGQKREVFAVTSLGYQVADGLPD